MSSVRLWVKSELLVAMCWGDSKVIHGFSTAQGVSAPNSHIVSRVHCKLYAAMSDKELTLEQVKLFTARMRCFLGSARKGGAETSRGENAEFF